MGRGQPSHANAIKLICTDVDGTLLNSDNVMLESSKRAMMDATNAGIPVAITTGKSATGPWLDEIMPHLPSDTPSVFCQGALLTDKEGNIISQESLDSKTIERILQFAEQHELAVAAFTGNDVIAKEQSRHTQNLIDIKEMEPRAVGDLRQYLIGSDAPKVNKMIFLHTADKIDDMEPKAREALDDAVAIMITLPGLLECMPKNATKGHGVKKLLEYMKVDGSEMMALGDGGNDLGFLEQAGIAVAMGNAKNEIKEVAHWHVATNNEDGWAEAVNKLLQARS